MILGELKQTAYSYSINMNPHDIAALVDGDRCKRPSEVKRVLTRYINTAVLDQWAVYGINDDAEVEVLTECTKIYPHYPECPRNMNFRYFLWLKAMGYPMDYDGNTFPYRTFVAEHAEKFRQKFNIPSWMGVGHMDEFDKFIIMENGLLPVK